MRFFPLFITIFCSLKSSLGKTNRYRSLIVIIQNNQYRELKMQIDYFGENMLRLRLIAILKTVYQIMYCCFLLKSLILLSFALFWQICEEMQHNNILINIQLSQFPNSQTKICTTWFSLNIFRICSRASSISLCSYLFCRLSLLWTTEKHQA